MKKKITFWLRGRRSVNWAQGKKDILLISVDLNRILIMNLYNVISLVIRCGAREVKLKGTSLYVYCRVGALI